MKPVKIKKEELIAILSENRNKHRESFERSWAAYERYLQERIRIIHERASVDGAKTIHNELWDLVRKPTPTNHTSEYDAMIQMIEMHDEPHWELTYQEFNQYVRDDWAWRREFASTNAAYGVASAADMDYLAEEG